MSPQKRIETMLVGYNTHDVRDQGHPPLCIDEPLKFILRTQVSIGSFSWLRTPIFDWYVAQQGSKKKHHKNICWKEIELHLRICLTTLHSIMNTIERTCVFNQGINKCALSITITKSREVQFPIQFLLKLYHRFTSATRVLIYKSSWRTWKTNRITHTYP